jgi:hypothetical protein
LPKLGVCLWPSKEFAVVLVPKATVNEHDRPVLRKDEIRTPRQVSIVKPIPITNSKESVADYALRLCVLSADPRHAVAALFGCKYITHVNQALPIRHISQPAKYKAIRIAAKIVQLQKLGYACALIVRQECLLSIETSPDPGLEILRHMFEAAISRFPLLQTLHFAENTDDIPAKLPDFVGLISALLQSGDKPCCVVLPSKTDVAVAVSVLVAVSRLRHDFADILRNHAAVVLKPGEDNVLVHPCGLVYRYEGFFNRDLFRLKVLNRNEARALPVTEIARLEKTMRKAPKGYLDSDFGQAQSTVLGSILGLKAAINRNLLGNYVLVLGSRKRFEETMKRWVVRAANINGHLKRSLIDEVACGRVDESGEVHFLDDYTVAGEPLIAATSNPDNLATHCVKAKKFSKSVLIAEIELLTRDLKAYDTITESQHTVVLASDAEHESVRKIAERGCEVWHLTSDEILYGVKETDSSVPLSGIISKARTYRKLIISGLRCEEEFLDRAATDLLKVSISLDASDNGAIRELLYALFRILMYCAQHLGPQPEHFASSAGRLLQVAKQCIDNAKVWLTGEAIVRVKEVVDHLEVAVTRLSNSAVTPKGELLLRALGSCAIESARIAVVVPRGETGCPELEKWLNAAGAKAGVYPLSGIHGKGEFDRIILVSWPRSERFEKLVHQYQTANLELLAYSFEEEWLNGYRKRHRKSYISSLSTKLKLRRLGLMIPPVNDTSVAERETPTNEPVKFVLSSEKYLARRKSRAADDHSGREGDLDEIIEAWYVDFVGPTFAYLTEGHDVPVLSDYVSGQVSSGRIPLRSVDALNEGEYVMFRESGDSDIIRFLAEDDVGKNKYYQLRLSSNRWRITLQKLGTDPKQVLDRLRPFGFSRHVQTVRGWLLNENIICPQDIRDVRMIAGAAHDKGLLASIPEIENARDEITSLHIRAGHRLTELLLKDLPKKISLLGQRETQLDLGVGKVWVVRIEQIDRTSSGQRRSHVDRLLWDSGAA